MTECTDEHEWQLSKQQDNSFLITCQNKKCRTSMNISQAFDMLNTQKKKLESAEFWSNWVYPEGATAEDVQNELADFKDLMDRFSKVLFHSTGGRMSKANYTVEAMCSEIDNYYAEGLT